MPSRGAGSHRDVSAATYQLGRLDAVRAARLDRKRQISEALLRHGRGDQGGEAAVQLRVCVQEVLELRLLA